MSSCDDLRRFAMALEGAEEKPHFGTPSFRLKGKMFAEGIPATNEAILKLSKLHQEILFETRPESFKPGVWGAIRWTRVALDGVAARELKTLLREAYDEVATGAAHKPPAKRLTAPGKKRPPE